MQKKKHQNMTNDYTFRARTTTGILEEKLKTESPTIQRQCGFIKGVVQAHQIKTKIDTICYYNFMNSRQLEQTFNKKLILYYVGLDTLLLWI
jgi:hypothetical protein